MSAAGIPIEEAEKKAVETALTPYVEKDGTVTYELIYFALQSQVLCKKSHEAAVVLRVMKFFCVCFAVFMGFNAVFLQTLGLGLGFVYMSMGIFVGPAVAPAAMAILMEKASPTWCTAGAVLGLCGGVATWILTAYINYEEVSLATLGTDYPFLFSNIVSICFSGAVAIGGSLAMPDATFKWKTLTVQLPLVDDMPPPIDDGRSAEELDAFLIKSYWRSVASTIFLFVFLCGLFPVFFYGTGMIFGATGFGIWIALFGLWCFIGGMSVIILPIVDFNNDVKAAAKKKAGNVEGGAKA
jgi:MFS family permease